MRAGKRSIRATFYEKRKSVDDVGEKQENLTPIYRTYVSLQAASVDSEDEDVSRVQKSALEVLAQYTARMDSLITTENIIEIKNKFYRIISVNEKYTRKVISYLVELYE